MKQQKFSGTGVAIVTPFLSDESIDFDGLGKLVEHLAEGGVNFLVVLGTTGESVTLSEQEKQEVFAFVSKHNAGRLTLVAGLGGNDTLKVAAEMQKFSVAGYEAFLSVTPYYNKPSQEGLFQHYSALASVSPLPIILYNVPGRTSVNMLPATTLRLADSFSNIIGVKEACGNTEQIMEVIRLRKSDFLVLSGDDNLTMPLVAAGADGVISVVANVFPAQFSAMVNATSMGNLAKARELHYQLMEFTSLLFAEGNPVGAKAALSHMGICSDLVRLPLVKASKGLHEKISKSLKEIAKSI